MNSRWRTQLLARMSAERAYLLRQLHGLSETTLTSSPVIGHWTAKDILAHIPLWDSYMTERMSYVLQGRVHEIPLMDDSMVEVINSQRYQQFKEAPLESALATFLKERSGFHALLKQIPDQTLNRLCQLSNGRSIRPRIWATRCWDHDAEHALELVAWRKKLPDTLKKQQIGPKYLLRAYLQASRKELLATADLIPEEERTSRQVCGSWTLKELIGHLADWEKIGLEGLQQLAAGQTAQFQQTIIPPFDAFNQKNVAARQGQTWDHIYHDLAQTRQQLMAAFDAMPASELSHSFISPWQRPITGYQWLAIWAGHDHEHALDIRATLALPTWPKRLKQ